MILIRDYGKTVTDKPDLDDYIFETEERSSQSER